MTHPEMLFTPVLLQNAGVSTLARLFVLRLRPLLLMRLGWLEGPGAASASPEGPQDPRSLAHP